VASNLAVVADSQDLEALGIPRNSARVLLERIDLIGRTMSRSKILFVVCLIFACLYYCYPSSS